MALLRVALALHNLSNKAAICSSMDLYSWKVWCTKSAKRMGQSRDTSSALVWTANAEVKTCVVNCAAALWMLWEMGTRDTAAEPNAIHLTNIICDTCWPWKLLSYLHAWG